MGKKKTLKKTWLNLSLFYSYVDTEIYTNGELVLVRKKKATKSCKMNNTEQWCGVEPNSLHAQV